MNNINKKYQMGLPPLKNLTDEQREIIDYYQNFSVYGGAGTGKTMVSIWRHIHNLKKGKSSYLITFTHTLTYFITKLVQQEISDNSINNIHSFIKYMDNFENIDELIIDEAQDLQIELHKKLNAKFKNISYGVDDNQRLYQNISNQENLKNLYKPKISKELTLNFRNSGYILALTQALFPSYGITDNMINYAKENYLSGVEPILIIYSSNNFLNYFYDILNIIEKNETIAILVPTINLIDKYRKILNDFGVKDEISIDDVNYTSYDYRDVGNIRVSGIARIHLTTFHSSKGLEFDNVIIPEFQNFSQSNQYYVGFTRAKTGLYLLSNNINPLQNIDKNLYTVEK